MAFTDYEKGLIESYKGFMTDPDVESEMIDLRQRQQAEKQLYEQLSQAEVATFQAERGVIRAIEDAFRSLSRRECPLCKSQQVRQLRCPLHVPQSKVRS